MFLAKMVEDGRKHITAPFCTVEEAKAAGKRMWRTNRFDIIELVDDGCQYGVYEAIRYVQQQESAQ